MPAAQGNKDQNFLTAKEKWLIGIFIATAVIASVTFVVNLVLIMQLKDSMSTRNTQSFNEIEELRNITLQNQKEAQKNTAKFENKMHQNEIEDLRQEFQTNVTQLQLQNQNETEELRLYFENRMTILGNQLKEAVVKTNILYHENKIDREGWKKLSNGLRYKRFAESISYAAAFEKCKIQRARLASTGIRNATIRSEIWDEFSGGGTWIGLTQSSSSTTWVWSDGKLYENTDILWAWKSCPTGTGRHGAIHFHYYSTYIYCYANNAYGYICEI